MVHQTAARRQYQADHLVEFLDTGKTGFTHTEMAPDGVSIEFTVGRQHEEPEHVIRAQ